MITIVFIFWYFVRAYGVGYVFACDVIYFKLFISKIMDSQEVDIETYLFTFIPQITEGFTEDDKKTEAYKNLEKQLEMIVSGAYNRYVGGEEVTKNFMYMRVIKQCLELAPTCFDKLMKSSLLNVKMLNK